MFDPTFTKKTLSSKIVSADYRAFQVLRNPAEKERILFEAESEVRNGIIRVHLATEILRGKEIYKFTDIGQDLIARKANENIKKISGVGQNDRGRIVRSIAALCSEGVPYRILKYDIKSFYESIDISELLSVLESRFFTNPSTQKVLREILTSCEGQGIRGLPRGVAISASLSELYLSNFDRAISKAQGVHFYARYVDDILIIADPTFPVKLFNRLVAGSLPRGLVLNGRKLKSLMLRPYDKKSSNLEQSTFDFLGYSFVVSGVQSKNWSRDVSVDIAPKKLARIKTRVVLSVRQYLRDGEFGDLYDRMRILTGTYRFIDRKTNIVKLGGLCHSHSLINCSSGLDSLDDFLRKVFSGSTGRNLGPLRLSPLSPAERKRIKQLSFKTGHRTQARFSIKNDRLIKLMECWKYV